MSIGHLLNDSIQLEVYNGMNAFGEESYDDPVTYPAYIYQNPKKVMGRNGEDIISNSFIVVEVAVGNEDRIILPDGSSSTVIMSAPVKGFTGTFLHSEVYI